MPIKVSGSADVIAVKCREVPGSVGVGVIDWRGKFFFFFVSIDRLLLVLLRLFEDGSGWRWIVEFVEIRFSFHYS